MPARGVERWLAQRLSRSLGATAGREDGETYISQVAPHVLPSGCVSVDRTATTVTVHVHCKITMSVVPFGSYWVDETVSGPVERFTG